MATVLAGRPEKSRVNKNLITSLEEIALVSFAYSE